MCAEQRNSRVFDAHFGGPETTQNLTTIYARPTTKSVLGENGNHHRCTQHRERGNTPIHFTVTSMPGRYSPPNSVRPCLEDRLNSTSVNFETHQAAHLRPLRIFTAPCDSFPSIWDWVTPDADEGSTPAKILPPSLTPLNGRFGGCADNVPQYVLRRSCRDTSTMYLLPHWLKSVPALTRLLGTQLSVRDDQISSSSVFLSHGIHQ